MSYQPPVTPGYTQPPAAWPPPQSAPRKSRAIPILVVALFVLAAVAGVLAFYLLRASAATPSAASVAPSAKIIPGAAFATIQQTCNTTAGYDIEDAGHTLILAVGGAYMNNDTMLCVFNGLNMPSSVREHVGTTRALDGQQIDSWDNYTARWTYHPDDGLQMTITES